MADDIVEVYQGGGTLAQAVLGSAPEGMLIAPVWKRICAFMLDVVMVTLVLEVITRFKFLSVLISWNYLTESVDYMFPFLITWFIFFMSFYLYWKYSGRSLGRSFGQRAFRIAIVHDNGTVLELHHWGPRAFGKLLYLLPIIGPLLFGLRDISAARSKNQEHRTSLDKKNHTVAAVDWSLPLEARQKLR